MTLYCVYAGGTKAEVDDIEAWLGEQFDGSLGYTEGWDPNNWEGLRPIVKSDRPGMLGATNRRIVWSIMFIPDVDHGNIQQGVNWYREVARGERNALYDQMGRDLMLYHDRIGDTGPIYVRSIWEIPGEWFAWNVAAVADVAAYIGAWRQFATAIRAGRPRIKVVWDFNSDRGEIEYLYPGDAYVDVISQDIYWIHDLQGTDPVDAFRLSRYGNQASSGKTYAWPLQRHFEWCKGKRKPMAISEWAVKLKDRPFQLNSTRWVEEFFGFIDYVNADPDVGMAYVSWWSNEEANVGSDGTNGFRDEAGEPHVTNVRNMFRARLPGTILGTSGPPDPPPPPDPDPTYPAITTTFGTGPDSLVLRVNQQPYLSVSAQYRVLIDSVQYGGTFTASATRASGLTDTLTLLGTFTAGSHAVRVEFLNDAYGGTAALDRNLYLVAATFNSVNIPGAPKDILGPNETAVFSFVKGAIIVPPPPTAPPLTLFSRARTPLISGRRPLGQAPANIASTPPVDQSATINIGSGADVLVLRITQDAWEGSARYTVSVDGVRIGAELEAVALRGRTLVDTVTVRGSWADGFHSLSLNFVNDASGGTPQTDRNLYLESVTFNGTAVAGSSLTFLSGGAQTVTFRKGVAPPPVEAGGTLIAAFVGGSAGEIFQFESDIGRQGDGYLAYNRDWYGTWEGCDPIAPAILNADGGNMGTTGRYLLWSYGCYPLGSQWGPDGYEAIRSIARGERYAVHKQHMQNIANWQRSRGFGERPAYVRILWEAPGEWFQWGAFARDDPNTWKEAFRQWAIAAHDADPIIKTVWDFNSDRSGPGAPELYPGDAYVDVISQDIYWDPIFDVQSDTGPNGEMIDNPVRAFNGHRGRNGGRYTYGLDWMVDFAAAHGKPVSISEFGAVIRSQWPNMNYTTWYGLFFDWVDEINASLPGGVLYVTNWWNEQAGVGSFSDYPEPHRTNIIRMHADRMPGYQP